jgi:single-strand DNA-binding protein
MNKVQLVGRLTKDPEVKLTPNQTKVCSFTIAVDRRFKDANGQRQADFINCVAWKQTAEFLQKYFHKGNRIGICGSIQTRSYEDQNGQNHFITEVLAEEVEFVESQGKPSQEEKIESEAPIEVNPNTGEVMNDGGTLPFEI